MTGPKNEKGETTWGGLAEEVRYWGNWVLKKVKAEIGDLYPLIPDTKFKRKKTALQTYWFNKNATDDVPLGYLMPVAYLWTRIVTCKNPNCAATVPLLKHTWLCKSKDRFVALKLLPSRSNKSLAYNVIEAMTEKGLGFDPELGSEGGSAACPFCSAVADAGYVQSEGVKKRIGSQLIAIVCTRENANGKVYLSVDDLPPGLAFDLDDIRCRLADVCTRSGISVPSEPIGTVRPSSNARGLSAVTRHGFTLFGELFAP